MSLPYSSLSGDESLQIDAADISINFRPQIEQLGNDQDYVKTMEETTSSFDEMSLDPPCSGSGTNSPDTEGHGSQLVSRGKGNNLRGPKSDQQNNCSGVQADVNQSGYSVIHQQPAGHQHWANSCLQSHQQYDQYSSWNYHGNNQANGITYPNYNMQHNSHLFVGYSWTPADVSMDNMSIPGDISSVYRMLPSQHHVRSEIGDEGLQPYDGGSFPSLGSNQSNVTLTPPNSGHFNQGQDHAPAMVVPPPISRNAPSGAPSPMEMANGPISSHMIGYSQMSPQPTIRPPVTHRPAIGLPSQIIPSQVPRQPVAQGHVPTIQGQTSGPQGHTQEQQTPVNEEFLRDVDSDGDSLFHLLSSIDKITVEHLKMLGGKEKARVQINLQNKLQQINTTLPHYKTLHYNTVPVMWEQKQILALKKIPSCYHSTPLTPLFLAVKSKHLMAVKILLHFGADPNIQSMISRDRENYVMGAPLHVAAMQGDEYLLILQELLSTSRIDVNILSIGSQLTPLHTALLHYRDVHNQVPYKETILELIRHGADITIPEIKSSKTVTMLVIESRDIELLRAILNNIEAGQCRKLLQQTTRSGDTCLHVASGLSRVSSQHKTALLRYLITKGADSNMANNARELPKELSPQEWRNLKIGST